MIVELECLGAAGAFDVGVLSRSVALSKWHEPIRRSWIHRHSLCEQEHSRRITPALCACAVGYDIHRRLHDRTPDDERPVILLVTTGYRLYR